jgi:hypothetical protein
MGRQQTPQQKISFGRDVDFNKNKQIDLWEMMKIC